MTTETLTLERAQWSDEAATFLARSCRKTPLVTPQDYRDLLAVDPRARLYRGVVGDRTVAYGILRVVHFSGGAEGEIVAVAGRLPGVDLVDAFLPALEAELPNVVCFRFTTARRGLVEKMRRHGYYVTHVTLRKLVT